MIIALTNVPGCVWLDAHPIRPLRGTPFPMGSDGCGIDADVPLPFSSHPMWHLLHRSLEQLVGDPINAFLFACALNRIAAIYHNLPLILGQATVPRSRVRVDHIQEGVKRSPKPVVPVGISHRIGIDPKHLLCGIGETILHDICCACHQERRVLPCEHQQDDKDATVTQTGRSSSLPSCDLLPSTRRCERRSRSYRSILWPKRSADRRWAEAEYQD